MGAQRRRSRQRRFWLLAVALAPLGTSSAPTAAAPLRVVTTSADLASLARSIGADRVTVESLASPAQDPHAFEVKPVQLAQMRRAELVIRIGLDHEPWLARLALPASVPVLDTSRSVRLIQTETPRLRVGRSAHVHAFGNTHYWLDPVNALAMAGAIRDALARARPADAAAFGIHHDAFASALTARLAGWAQALAPFRRAKIVVIHDSWSYFAEHFGLQIVAAAEPRPGVPPAPVELATLLQRMRESGVRVVIADAHANASLIGELERRGGALAVMLAPSGTDYLQLIDDNVTRLAAALRRAGP